MPGQIWSTHGHGFATTLLEADLRYGPVKLASGRTIYRNYRRPLKNGKGLSLIEVVNLRHAQAADEMAAAFAPVFFN